MFRSFRKVVKTGEPELEWPNTTPIDKSDPYWKFNNNATINGIPYKKEEVSPGRWQWVVNEVSLRRINEQEQHREGLATALQTRVLTEEEMQEAMGYGIDLFIQNMVPYREADKHRQFNEAICQQYRLRTIESSVKGAAT